MTKLTDCSSTFNILEKMNWRNRKRVMNTEEIKRLNFNGNLHTIFYRSFHTNAGCKCGMDVKRCLRLSLQSGDLMFGSYEHWKGIERMRPFVYTEKSFKKGLLMFIECLFSVSFFTFVWIIASTWIKDQSKKLMHMTISHKNKSRNEIYSHLLKYFDSIEKKHDS